jgi:hypothetical protein
MMADHTIPPRPRFQLLTMGREEAERFIPGEDDVCISILSPGAPPAVLREGWRAVLRLEFHDFPWPDRDAAVMGAQQITEAQADQVIAFVEAHAQHAKRIVVHCEAGISRSVAIALALGSCYLRRWCWPSWYRAADRERHFVANRIVFYHVIRAWKRAGGSERNPAFRGPVA